MAKKSVKKKPDVKTVYVVKESFTCKFVRNYFRQLFYVSLFFSVLWAVNFVGSKIVEAFGFTGWLVFFLTVAVLWVNAIVAFGNSEAEEILGKD